MYHRAIYTVGWVTDRLRKEHLNTYMCCILISTVYSSETFNKTKPISDNQIDLFIAAILRAHMSCDYVSYCGINS